MKKQAVLILSGGLDSSTLLVAPPDDIEWVAAVSVDYGQRHRRELRSAAEVAKREGVPHTIIDLSSIGSVLKGGALTDPNVAVPHGHYEAESMKATVVPNRNMILISVASGYAISMGASILAYGAHAGDHAIYADCRPEFYEAMGEALAVCHETPVELIAPFINLSKADIVRRGFNSGHHAAAELSWSCYEGGDVHCGKCGTCVERIEAFKLAGVPDPTRYAL